MGRKEERYKRKLGMAPPKPSQVDKEKMLTPFMMGDTKIIPVTADQAPAPEVGGSDMMTADEFQKITHTLSDKELNRIIYQNARDAVENGLMPPWPKDDYGTVMWFTWNFITDEMREAFPAIAKEYLKNYRHADRDGQKENADGTRDQDRSFDEIPYPRMNEATWDDAYYFRILLMMLYSARRGSAYSRNFLLSLYKVYYKQEYSKVKRLRVLTYLDVLELHDEDCRRRGLPSGHTLNGEMSFRDMTIEKRKHEPGWTNALGNRILSPVPGKKKKDIPNADILNEAVADLMDISNSPDEPPVQPAASRLFIMCGLMDIPIDATCTEQAVQMNDIADSMAKLTFLNSPEYRKLRGELVERMKGMLRVDYPEMFDPYDYQRDEHYYALQMAELVMGNVMGKYDANIRMPYGSRKFDLPQLMADMTITIHASFPDLKMSFNEGLMLAMVQYLSECLCELMSARDEELEDILGFHRKKEAGEWDRNEPEDEKDTVKSNSKNTLAEKVMRSVENLRSRTEPGSDPAPPQEELDEAGLREEIERLEAQLEEKAAALAEAEQKLIRQRVLYEKAHEREQELDRKVDEQAVEHAELIALREFVYGLRNETEVEELDEQTREQIIEAIKDRKVAVLGGTERWTRRMKRLLPSWSFVSVEDNSIGGFHALERADIIYIYSSALKHSQYYRAMSLIRSSGKMLFYLKSTNTDESLQQFYRELCRQSS